MAFDELLNGRTKHQIYNDKWTIFVIQRNVITGQNRL